LPTALLLASALTPHGLATLAYPFRLFARIAPGQELFTLNISENRPLLTLLRDGDLLAQAFLGALLLATFALLLLWRSARRTWRSPAPHNLLPHTLLFLALTALALQAERNLLLWLFCLPPLLLGDVAPHLPAAPRPLRLLALSALLLLVPLEVRHLRTLAQLPSATQPAPFRLPEGAATYLAANPTPGTLFSVDHHGGYLNWRLFPQQRAWIDGRFILQTPARFSKYLGLLDRPTIFDGWSRAHGVSAVLLPSSLYPRYAALRRHLAQRPEQWSLTFADEGAVLFERRESGSEIAEVRLVARHDPSQDLRRESRWREQTLATFARRYPDRPLLQREAELRLNLLSSELTAPRESTAQTPTP
jgi:hypothetical protein